MFADSGRSFNITLTERGLRALRMVGLEQKVIASGMKCYGRHVHQTPKSGSEVDNTPTFWTAYGCNTGTDFLLSISRVKLNKILLEEMVLRSAINIFYGKEVTKTSLNPCTNSHIVFRSQMHIC